jgi:hypothetical protein
MSDHPVEPPYNPHYFPDFDPPYPSQQFNDVMYKVSGRTRAENHLITLAQDEFLSCWLNDERMAARLQTWSASIGLPEIINDIAAFLDRVADLYGLSRRGDLGRIPRPSHISVEALLPEWYELQDRLYAAYRRSPEIRDAACTYVCDELQKPWCWLAYRLTNHVFEQAWDRALGIMPVRSRPSHLDDHIYGPYVQPLEHTLKTKPGELVYEATKRLDAEYKAFRANLQSTECELKSLPKGKARSDREHKTRQYAKWLYFHLIHNKEPTALARTFHTERQERGKHQKAFRSCACLQDVKYGLEQAEQLLNLNPYRFEES